MLGQPSIGSLVYAVDSCTEKSGRSNMNAIVVEMCLYLIWHHINLYMKLLDKTDENRLAIEQLKESAPDVLSDPFFNKVQNILQVRKMQHIKLFLIFVFFRETHLSIHLFEESNALSLIYEINKAYRIMKPYKV